MKSARRVAWIRGQMNACDGYVGILQGQSEFGRPSHVSGDNYLPKSMALEPEVTSSHSQ
jgi:hypothetical protein